MRLANDPPTSGNPVTSPTPPQDDRVIVETNYDVVEEEVCDCEDIIIPTGGFPYYALLPLAAVPLFFIPNGEDEPDETPTQTPPSTMTTTPTPPPDPVPEPMTILLFGTGLAGIGMAARRKFGKNADEEDGSREISK